MRPVLHGDVVAAARVLYVLPEALRLAELKRLIRKARWADAFRRQSGKVHPVWGDGSLMTAALAAVPPPEPPLDDADYCGCLAMVFEGLVAELSCGPRLSPGRS